MTYSLNPQYLDLKIYHIALISFLDLLPFFNYLMKYQHILINL
jgi:hypothetical protein